jgi:hypothetical protein
MWLDDAQSLREENGSRTERHKNEEEKRETEVYEKTKPISSDCRSEQLSI